MRTASKVYFQSRCISSHFVLAIRTWNDGVISVVNPVAAARGVKVGMSAEEAARLML